jgi:FSR family fosmidomycin resistance protein-like MFS transporter
MQKRISALSVLHFVVDTYALMIPALWLPVQHKFGLTPSETGLVLGICTLTFNLMQPLWGILSDRFDARWAISGGPLIAVAGVGLAIISPILPLTVLWFLIGGIGIGIFHPEAGVTATRLGRLGSSRTMGIFLVGGFLGQAFGPWWISIVLTNWTGAAMIGTMTMLPGIVLAIIGMAMFGRPLERDKHVHEEDRVLWRQAIAGRHRPIWTLLAVNVTRYFSLFIILFSVPMYLEKAGHGQMMVGQWIGIFLAAQGVGLLLGGVTAGLNQERSTCIASTAAGLIPLILLPFLSGTAALVCMIAAGVIIAWAHAVVIQLGQGILPHCQRWVTGILIGFASGIVTLISPQLVGWLFENVSVQAPFVAAAVFGVAALIATLLLPSQATLDALRDT